MSSPHIHLSLSEKKFWEDDFPFPRCHYGYCQGICVPVCISSSTMWPARTEIGTEPAHHRPHMCDCDGAYIMHTKLSQPQNCHKPRRKRSKRTQSVQVIHPSPVAQQGCARGPGLNLPVGSSKSLDFRGQRPPMFCEELPWELLQKIIVVQVHPPATASFGQRRVLPNFTAGQVRGRSRY